MWNIKTNRECSCFLDFEKAFDSVSWNYIHKVLVFFNFGEYFVSLVKIILTNIKLCVIQHGVFSEFFTIGRGCRQGDPASPYIFLLCVEIMGLMVRQNKDISGIHLFGKEYTLIQYADDTTILLDGSEKSLKSALSLVEKHIYCSKNQIHIFQTRWSNLLFD